jgi:hypothetical protein
VVIYEYLTAIRELVERLFRSKEGVRNAAVGNGQKFYSARVVVASGFLFLDFYSGTGTNDIRSVYVLERQHRNAFMAKVMCLC